VVLVAEAVARAATRARSGGGPTVIEALTYRHFGHSRTDPAKYRPACLGEDIGAAGGVFKTAAGLFEEFGPERIWDTPISEQAILGAAMGADRALRVLSRTRLARRRPACPVTRPR
jgi:hypothetical protein